MKNRVFAAIVLAIACIVCSSVSAQQTRPKSVTQLPKQEVEPFKIGRGTSFSASVPRAPENKNLASRNINPIGTGQIEQDLNEALKIINDYYVDGRRVNYNALTKSSIDSMLRALDPHSNFYDAAEYREMLEEQRSEYTGIGASIVNYTIDGATDTFVTSTFPDSPASRAGLQFGDKIVAVGGVNMRGKSSFYVREQIRGERGRIVRVTVERASTQKVETLEIRRGVVPQPSIPDAYLLRPGIGYIDFSNGFNYTTEEELQTALEDLREQGMTSLILDLRDNPGGILEQAVRVAQKFLPAGSTIVTQRGRFAIDNRTWRSTNRDAENFPLVVLVNGGSASASEIVAGALQDYDRALIVGQNTFGKGLVQSIINLPLGTGLTLTTAKYYTPSGRSIQRDYSSGNLYDYFRHKANFEERRKSAGKTITGRTVYGGNGIEPDEVVQNQAPAESQTLLLDPLFFFTREVVAGRFRGLESYKLTRPVQYGQRVRPSDFPVSEELFNAFKKYAAQSKSWRISNEQMEANRKFILTRLRFNLATAAFGNIAANQVLIEDDPQVAKAVELLPRAQNLALAARKTLQKR
ncbi:MAG TPA: S41 family peptidase [Pyrinomonadaceae bacterium]|jgi:carboxyl-terminal processing protease